MTAAINVTSDKNKKASNFQASDHKHITRWNKGRVILLQQHKTLTRHI